MNEYLSPNNVVEVINSFLAVNKGDEASENLILAIGAELLDVSEDMLMEMIEDSKENADIRSFSGKYAFLSNFFLAPIEYEGRCYVCSEAAYQAQKNARRKHSDRVCGSYRRSGKETRQNRGSS